MVFVTVLEGGSAQQSPTPICMKPIFRKRPSRNTVLEGCFCGSLVPDLRAPGPLPEKLADRTNSIIFVLTIHIEVGSKPSGDATDFSEIVCLPCLSQPGQSR